MSDDPIVIRGRATSADVAAIIAAIASLRASLPGEARRPRSLWARPSRQTRPPLSPGPGAWRASALPR
ncbi:MAG: acyl-CoA carboxylase subunit epsilon [Actinobacteria bacterium]|nr:acyl-CoA carboxylase subunit epsilon [Actinomycetota bacterium]